MDLKTERSSLRLMYSFGLKHHFGAVPSTEEMAAVSDAKNILTCAQELFDSTCRSKLPPEFITALAWPESPVLHISEGRSECNGLTCVALKAMLTKVVFTRDQVKLLHALANECIAQVSTEQGIRLEFQGAIVMVDSYSEFSPTDLV